VEDNGCKLNADHGKTPDCLPSNLFGDGGPQRAKKLWMILAEKMAVQIHFFKKDFSKGFDRENRKL
jgi:hypothetical protein